MKKQLILLFAILTLTFCSCGKGEILDLVTDMPATKSQIQGSWMLEKNAYFYTYTFRNGTYDLEMRNALADKGREKRESGTYEMEGNVMTLTPFEGTALCPVLTAYWEDLGHNVLNLAPLGHFNRQ